MHKFVVTSTLKFQRSCLSNKYIVIAEGLIRLLVSFMPLLCSEEILANASEAVLSANTVFLRLGAVNYTV